MTTPEARELNRKAFALYKEANPEPTNSSHQRDWELMDEEDRQVWRDQVVAEPSSQG